MSKNAAYNLIKLLESAGYSAYLVGGCVRDEIMHRPATDFDITTSATPQNTISVLQKAGVRYVETGLKHGTVTAIVDGNPFEITTFRTESGYSDNRRPDSVLFVSDIKDDLSRRDFTINAMAYNTKSGLIDLFGGKADIENKIIKTVGEPSVRFGEDALRILRALRFASTLSFDIEKNTAREIEIKAPLLLNVAGERITAELEKMIKGDSFLKVLKAFPSVFSAILPSFRDLFEKHAIDIHIQNMSKLPMSTAVFMLYLNFVINDKKSEKHACFDTLKLPNIVTERVKNALFAQNINLSSNSQELQKQMYLFGKTAVFDAALIKQRQDVLNTLNDIENTKKPYLIAHLNIDGNDLIGQGITGKNIKLTLEKLLFDVIDGKIQNNKASLLNAIKKD